MNTVSRTLKFVSLVLLNVGLSQARAEYVVVPPSLAAVDVPTAFGCLPLSTCTESWSELRYQQIYDASNFGGMSGTITSMAFREDQFGGGGMSFLNATITLSNSPRSAATMSNFFAENVGPDVTTVFSGDLALVIPPHSTTFAVNPFSAVIPFATPWFYDGVSNILVEFRTSNMTGNGILWDEAPGGTPGMYYKWANDNEAGVGSSSFVGSSGIVTRFELENTAPVPEPFSSSLLLVGVGGLLLARQRCSMASSAA